MKLSIATEEGNYTAHYSGRGLARLDFPLTDKAHTEKTADESKISSEIKHWHQLTAKALHDSLKGRTPRELPPLDLTSGTEFQRRVWTALLRIAVGHTQSYAEVAAAIGLPKAVRAVGGACGANPIPVLVPCHRVLAVHHRLGGFTSGLDRKRKLLALEYVGILSLV